MPGDVHVWCASLKQSMSTLKQFANILSPKERKRADQFYFEKDKNHYITGHGVIKVLLSRYLNKRAKDIGFCYGPYGKPECVDQCNNKKIYFNYSHSEEVALYAFSIDNDLGIDVEYIRDIADMNQIVNNICSQEEIIVFETLAESDRRTAFFNCWTRKEAFIKAVGKGLSMPLDQFKVSFLPNKPAKLLSVNAEEKTKQEWHIQDLKPAYGYAAAIAVKGPPPNLKYFQVPKYSDN